MIERGELQDSAQKAFPSDKLRPDRDPSWRLISKMGWLLLPVPVQDGGLGLGRDSAATIHFELGRVLSTAPLIPAMIAIKALCGSDEIQDRPSWIERATAGELFTLSLLPGDVVASAGVINGTLPAVADADLATHVLVFAPDLVALVPLDAPGVSVVERGLWDESRRLFVVTIADYRPGHVLAEGSAAQSLAAVTLGELQLALAADCLGGASAALEISVEYLKTRKQFDRPLAMFQALKHRCADLKTQLVSAEALFWERCADHCASTIDLGAIKARASDVFRTVAEEAIQLHGGIGLTEEHSIHLFMKRAMLNLQLGGSLDQWREQVGRQALLKAV